jgi:redox-sensitive bicupin YhaK (pirin superfamily)
LAKFRLQPGAAAIQDLPADYNAFFVALEGEGAIGEARTAFVAGDVAWLTREESRSPSETMVAASDKGLRALLYAGRPPREPVVAGGPFVMNTREEIEQAYAGYRAGRFGPG